MTGELTKGLTEAQRGSVVNYDRGDVVKVQDPAGKARYLTVERTDTRANVVHAIDEAGVRALLQSKTLAKAQAYSSKKLGLRVGDRVSFHENAKALGLKNGDQGTVRQMGARHMKVDIAGRLVDVDLSAYRQIDHGYVVTSYKAQGQTQDRALIHHNTGSGVHSQRETYVNVTRARLQTKIYTQDRGLAAIQGAKRVDKSMALGGRAKQADAGVKTAQRAPEKEQGLQI